MEIQILKKQGWSLREIAEEVGCAVNTVRHHLAAEGKLKYERMKNAHEAAAYKGWLTQQVQEAIDGPRFLERRSFVLPRRMGNALDGGFNPLDKLLLLRMPAPIDYRFWAMVHGNDCSSCLTPFFKFFPE